MFRDPQFYKSVATNVIPYLKSYQRIKVWNAGCSTGEELYSYAILFSEENLYERCFLWNRHQCGRFGICPQWNI
ncbi:CheR family methyltransferase [Pedobacter steynii]